MKITEKVLEIMPLAQGTSGRTGDNWYNQELVLETEERYPKQIAMTFKGANVKKLEGLEKGDKVEVTFDIESHKYNERYYTQLLAWELKVVEKAAPSEV